MANSFKSNVPIDVETTGNVVYTCPAATETTLIGMTLSNKSNTTMKQHGD